MTLPRYAPGPIITEREHPRGVLSWVAGTHYPAPYLLEDRWFCHDCGRPLRTYTTQRGERRLRHFWGRG